MTRHSKMYQGIASLLCVCALLLCCWHSPVWGMHPLGAEDFLEQFNKISMKHKLHPVFLTEEEREGQTFSFFPIPSVRIEFIGRSDGQGSSSIGLLAEKDGTENPVPYIRVLLQSILKDYPADKITRIMADLNVQTPEALFSHAGKVLSLEEGLTVSCSFEPEMASFVLEISWADEPDIPLE